MPLVARMAPVAPMPLVARMALADLTNRVVPTALIFPSFPYLYLNGHLILIIPMLPVARMARMARTQMA